VTGFKQEAFQASSGQHAPLLMAGHKQEETTFADIQFALFTRVFFFF
jgi:hypothetical protein